MFKKLKIVIAGLMLVPFLVSSGGALAYNPLDNACQGSAADSPTCQQAKSQGTTNPIAGPNGIINKAANIIALVAVVGGIIMIIIGAFEFITAGGSPVGQRAGDPNKAKQARTRILSAVIGIAIVSLAWAIVRLITDRILQ